MTQSPFYPAPHVCWSETNENRTSETWLKPRDARTSPCQMADVRGTADKLMLLSSIVDDESNSFECLGN